MYWERKAAIARICARLPYGDQIYKLGQKRFGALRADPTSRLSKQVEMARWLLSRGEGVSGKSFFEVGTGHVPVVPIGLYLSGAKETITVDLNRRIDWDLTRQALEWMACRRPALAALYGEDVVSREVFEERFAALVESRGNAREFLASAGIRYLAPVDAANTGLAAESVDCHSSVTVLEHIAERALGDILAEAKRILKPDGHALHFIDLSDHFQHQDKSISRINFLRFSEAEWRRLAGNRFAYCSRLRASDFLRLISDAGFRIVRCDRAIDEQSKDQLRNGFPVDAGFGHYDQDDLCTTSLRVLLKK